MEQANLQDANFDKKHALICTLNTAESLGWHVLRIDQNGVEILINNGFLAKEGRLTVGFGEHETTLNCVFDGNPALAEKNANRELAQFVDVFTKIKTQNKVEDFDLAYDEFCKSVDIENGAVYTGVAPTKNDKIKEAFKAFVPQEGFAITPIIIILNVLLFIIMVASGVHFMSPAAAEILPWGACLRTNVLNGEWWRLLSAVFIHIGILHLAFNMYALYYIGALTEPLLGKSRFLAAYIITGICSSLLSIYWNVHTTSAGASGAIFGMYGVIFALLTTNLIKKEVRNELLKSIGIFIALNLALGMREGIDAAGHIGGLLSGLVIGYAFYFTYKYANKKHLANMVIAMASILTIALVVVTIKKLPDTMAHIEKAMQQFSDRENESNQVFELTEGMPKDSQIHIIKTKGVQLWKENKESITKIQANRLPNYLEKRMESISKYCDAKIIFNELLLSSINQPSLAITDSIRKVDSVVKQMVEELNK